MNEVDSSPEEEAEKLAEETVADETVVDTGAVAAVGGNLENI